MSEKIDINELELVNDQIDIDVDSDPFAMPDPPPDGIHVVKLTRSGEWQKGSSSKDNRPFLMTNVRADIIAEGKPYDGQGVFDMISTLSIRGGASRAVGVLVALGKKKEVAACRTNGEVARVLNDVLTTEPLVRVQTQWELRKKTTDTFGNVKWTTELRGQKNFPRNGKGEFLSTVNDPEVGLIQARAAIIRYLPLKEGGE